MAREEFLALLPELVSNYQPSQGVVEKIASVRLLMIIGPSGVGKTTLMNKINMPFVPSDTTRPQRPGEVDGIDYYFRQDYDTLLADIKKGNFLQIVLGVGGDLYATRYTSYPENGMGVMAVVADVIPHFRRLGFKQTVSAFITPPSFKEWQRRISAHNLPSEQLNKRLIEAQISLRFALSDKETHMILNDDLDSATTQINRLIEGQVDVEMEKAAKYAAQTLLSKLD